MRDSQWCINHHPDQAEARHRRASKGGKRGGRGRPQVEVNNLKERLMRLADDTLSGETDKGVAAVASQVFNVYLRAISVELKVKEVTELGERICALEGREPNSGGQRYGA